MRKTVGEAQGEGDQKTRDSQDRRKRRVDSVLIKQLSLKRLMFNSCGESYTQNDHVDQAYFRTAGERRGRGGRERKGEEER